MIAAIRLPRQAGFTLIELMVAMALGLLVAAGIVTIFSSTSDTNKADTQLATLQEAGRFAVSQLKNDLSMANGGQFCSNSGGDASPSSVAGTYLDGLRTPTVDAASTALTSAMSDLTTPWGTSPYPATPTTQYSMPSFMSMRGYDCTTTACTPMDPSSTVSANGFSIPAMGKTVGSRVEGTAVLTVRYMNPSSGWAITSAGSTLTNSATGVVITLSPQTFEPKASNFKSGDLAMLADCSNAQVFAATLSGTTITSGALGTAVGQNFVAPVGRTGQALEVFDFNRDYQTVTYYVKVVSNGDSYGHTTGALIRRVNGGSANAAHNGSETEVVRGVERMDFKYGVEYPDGTVRFLTAAQVDASNNTTPGCTVNAAIPISGSTDPGCLWRAIVSIQVDLLVDGQVPLYTLTSNEEQYTYATDGVTSPQAPSSGKFNPAPSQQGFVDQMIRREFISLVALRNFNP
ncbi:PilW family protein [Dyella sp.]|uniref:PilW family protein n=1 Tax=Dyella sp. TaxID=1869338 RepID=UPI002FDB394F